MEKRKLIRTFVSSLEPRAKPYTVFDAALPGFGVTVLPSGSKSYILRYRPKGAGRAVNPRTLTVGRHPAITPERARDIAHEKLSEIAAGRDPTAERRDKLTVAQVLDRYLDHLDGKPSRRTVEGDVRLHLKPALGGLLVRELTPEKVEAQVLDPLKRAGKVTTAGRAVRTLRAALRHARVDDKAASEVRAPGWKHRRRVAQPDELRRFFEACSTALRDGSAWPFAIWLFMLLLFTGARPSEIRTAQWSDVDLEKRRIVRSTHKTAHKTGEDRIIELPPVAVEILAAMERLNDNPYVIPGKVKGQPLQVYDKPWKRVCELAGIQGLWVYDLRRALPSLGLGLGFGLRQLGEVLGHRHDATTAGYAWLMPGDRTRVVGAVADHLQELAGPALPAIGRRPRGDT